MNDKTLRIPLPMGSLYGYIYCMLASQALVDMPIFGGALFMCARLGVMFYQAFRRRGGPGGVLRKGMLAALLVLNLCVVVIYPTQLDSPRMWVLFALTLLMEARTLLDRRLMRVSVAGGMDTGRFALLLLVQQTVALGAVAWILLYNLPRNLAWPLLGGYGLCSVISLYGLGKERALAVGMDASTPQEDLTRLHRSLLQANAYAVYERLSTWIMLAMDMTLVLMYTFLASSAEQLLWYMVLAVLCTVLPGEGAEHLLHCRERRGKRSDPTNLMLLGLAVWLYALAQFSVKLGMHKLRMFEVYYYLGMCSAATSLCMVSLRQMEACMAAVASFASGEAGGSYRRLRAAALDYASMLGQMLALAALTVMCFATGRDLPRSLPELAVRFRPVMVLPALLMVLGAILATLKFPLSSRYMHKLSRFLHLKETGGDNPALRRQLEAVVVRRHTQPFFIRVLMAFLRPFYRHSLKGVENIVQDEDNPTVFLCNHGEMYGPIVCMLFIPVPIRPWTISEMSIDPEEVAAYIHKYTISRQQWLPEGLKWPIARLIGPLSVWTMNKLETIPVFRNKPRELMNTFRRSVEAMEAGDNLLIFPENPDGVEQGKGYERAGVGEMFRGYAMLAQIYYNRTGKRCRFLPMFGHKGMRTLSFGEYVYYDPDNEPIVERDRIVDAVTAQMQQMAQREEALYQQKKRQP